MMYRRAESQGPMLWAGIVVYAMLVIGQAAFAQMTWAPPAALNTNATADLGIDGALEIVATDGSGHWVAAWGSNEDLAGAGTDYDIFVARSTDNGASWTAPALLNSNATTDTGADYCPRVATDGAGHWVANWESFENIGGAGTDSDSFVSRSTDNGATWTPPTLLNSSGIGDSGTDQYAHITTDGAGHWVAAWGCNEDLAGSGGDSDIFVSRSTDNGATWTPPALLNSSGTTDSGVARDGQVELSTDSAGNWIAVWKSEADFSGAGEDWDIFVARSTDNGANWTATAVLNTNGTTDDGRDVVPHVTTDGAGHWVVVWESTEDLSGAGTDQDIFVARSTDNGASWTPPAVLNTNATSDEGDDYNPRVTTDGAGHWIAVWHSEEDLAGAGTDMDILLAYSSDNGATWTPPALLNSNGTADLGADRFAQLTTDRVGHWVATWYSTEDLAGTGTDEDIFFSTPLADTVAPTATITLLNTSPTGADAVDFEVAFDELVGPTFDASDVSLTGDLAGAVSVGGADPTFAVTVTLTDPDADGTIGIAVAGGAAVTDFAGNPYAGGSSALCEICNWAGFIEDPHGTRLYSGDAHTFTVGASCAWSYQWKWDDGISKSIHDVGDDSPTYAIPDVTGLAGDYWCEVTYDGETHPSATATLEVEDHLVIVDQPVGGEYTAGQSHCFTVTTAGGYAPLTYTWKKDGEPVSGAAEPSYTIDPLQVAHSGEYLVEVNDDNTDMAVSDAAGLTVSQPVPAAGLAAAALLAAATVAAGLFAVRKNR